MNFNKIFIYKSIFLSISIILINISMCVQDNANNVIIQKEKKSLNYSTHLATGLLAHISLPITTIGGFLIGEVASNNNMDTWIYRNFNFQPPLLEGELNENLQLMCFVSGIPTLFGLLAGLYFVYKTPQWTETYILRKNDTRTTKQNIINFINRILLPYPFGVVCGEFFSH